VRNGHHAEALEDQVALLAQALGAVFSSQNLGGLSVAPRRGARRSKIPNTTKDDKNPG
jgi:hypothetical protein